MEKEKKSYILEKITLRLRISGILSARDLQTATGLSQPQLSRYLKLIGSQLLTLGSGKTTRYILTREVTQTGDRVPVYNVDQKGKLLQTGTLYPVAPKGFCWTVKNSNKFTIYDDLPYFLNDLRPSGFLGRLIPRTYPEWKFPEDIRLWSAESTLRYLTHFGVDLIGNQIIGEVAAEKFLQTVSPTSAADKKTNEIKEYEEIAKRTETQGLPGSSAGGEHPKFVTRRPIDQTAVIVKFVSNSDSEITQRRIDLLRAEHIASLLFLDKNQSTPTRIIQGDAYTFLEIVRFDRLGVSGRKGIISLFSLDAEFTGSGASWSVVAQKLQGLKIIDQSTVEEIQFLEYFGQCIGNTDMHSGNLSLYFEQEKVLGLAPVYDMLPMKYAPLQERLPLETVTPTGPKPSSIEIWEKAKDLAIRYWQQIQATKEFSPTFLDIARRNEQYLNRF